MKLCVTDSFDLLKYLPEAATIVTRQLSQKDAMTMVQQERFRYNFFCDSVHKQAAEKALGTRLADSRLDPAVAPGDRVLVVSSSFKTWNTDTDTSSQCNQFWLVQIAL
jgi:hypothetical protein